MTSPAPLRPRTVFVGSAFFALGSITPLLIVTQARNDPTFRVPIIDADTYHRQAVSFAQGEPLQNGPFWQPPLYPLFLGVVYRAFGVGPWAPRVIQALLAGACCAMTWWIGRDVFDARVGMIAGIGLALHGPFLFFADQLLPPALATFLDLLAVVVLITAVKKGGFWRWVGFGSLVGLSMLAVPNAVVLAGAGGAYALLRAWREGAWRRGAACGLGLAAGVVWPILITAYRNYSVSGHWVWISTNGGINFYLGNNPQGDALVAIRPGYAWKQLLRTAHAQGYTDPIQESAFFQQKALDYMTGQPLDFVRHTAAKLVGLINARELPRNVDVYTYREFYTALKPLVWRWGGFAFPMGVIGPLAVMGLLAGLSNPDPSSRAMKRLLTAFLLLYGLSIAAFFVSARYRLPLAPILLVFAAWGATWFFRTWVNPSPERERPAARRWAPLLGGVAALVGMNLPISAATDGIDFRAELEVNVARILMDEGEFDQARRRLEFARRLNPDYAPADHQLALLEARRERVDRALPLFESAHRKDPTDVETCWMLGQAHALRGDDDAAIDYLQQALVLDPLAPEPQAVLGDIALKQNRPAEAVERYRTALKYPPIRPELLMSLADALAASGDYAQAKETYRQASHHLPSHPPLLRKIALFLSQCPDPDLKDCDVALSFARELYRQTGPQDPIALETLGIALAECGSKEQALRTLDQALLSAKQMGDEALVRRLQTRRDVYAGSSNP